MNVLKTNLPVGIPGQVNDQLWREQMQSAISAIADTTRGELLHAMYPSTFPAGAVVSADQYNVVMQVTARDLRVAMLRELSRLFQEARNDGNTFE